MKNKNPVSANDAPLAIGTYSQAIITRSTVYISGQIPLDSESMELVGPDIDLQVKQVMKNLDAICQNAGGSLNSVVKFTVFITNLDHFTTVNRVMQEFLQKPYPARSLVQVTALPKQADIEIDAIMEL
tara:strand:- start:303 stop:686 length:384 start_codon:yes stop_codon:yes gene_type:complete